ncbi:hypothetical protein QFZ91_003019 [Paraburkholderia sp. JPY419]
MFSHAPSLPLGWPLVSPGALPAAPQFAWRDEAGVLHRCIAV